jgi:predicted Zn-dependent protease
MATLLAVVACAPIQTPMGPMGTITAQIGGLVKPALQSPAFRTQAFDVSDVYKANVSVNGPGMGAVVNATGNPIAMPNGQGASAVPIVVPTGNNRVITAQGLDNSGTALASWITVKGVSNVSAGVNAAVPVNWTTTPTAKVVEALMTAGSPFAATVDTAALQTLVNQITVPSGAAPNTTYTVHPSRVDATVIANAIIANGGTVPGAPPPGSTIAAGTISGTISGLVLNKTATVVANDPASAAVTSAANGSYTITGVTPGTGITVKATTAFTDDGSTTTTVPVGGAGAANVSLTALHYVSRSLYGDGGGIANKVMRWSRMPIQILIVRPSNPAAIGWTADHETAYMEALNRWTSQLGDLISFNVTTTMDNSGTLAAQEAAADIYVTWLSNFGDTKLGLASASWGYCGGCSPNAANLAVNVQLATKLQNNDPLPDYLYRGVAIHEMGHALGSLGNPSTNGHSDADTDNMFWQTDAYWPINLIPTARDFKTLRLIYTSPADITRLP